MISPAAGIASPRSRDVFSHFHFDMFIFVGQAAALGRRISVFAERAEFGVGPRMLRCTATWALFSLPALAL